MTEVKTSKKETLFIDTNVFIHMRDLKDLPWTELFPNAKQIDLMVSARIIEELDDFKIGGNGRKRKRARKALNLIKAASINEGMVSILRDQPIKIRIIIADLNATNWEGFPKLDSSKPDDHLIADACNFGNDAIVFSFDTGPLVTARRMGIKAVEPLEDWLLPIEPSNEEIKNKRLEQQLSIAQATTPKIIASFGYAKAPFPSPNLIVPILPPLEKGLVHRLTQAYLDTNPAHDIPVVNSPLLIGLSAFLKTSYTKLDRDTYLKEYRNFGKQVRHYFENLHELVTKVSLAQSIPFYVENSSSVTAKGLRVECRISDNCYLLANDKDVAKSVGGIVFPRPPKKPKLGQNMFSSPALGISVLGRANRERDPTKFYWQENPEFGDQKSALQCEDFRATEVFEGKIWIYALADVPLDIELEVKISATNLPEPILVQSKFQLNMEETDWVDERVHNRLPVDLSTMLKSLFRE